MEEVDGNNRKCVVHVNNVTQFRNREQFVGAVTVVAEEKDFVEDLQIMSDVKCSGVDECELAECLSEFEDVMSEAGELYFEGYKYQHSRGG